MEEIKTLLESLTVLELQTLPALIKDEIKRKKALERKALISNIVEKASEVNTLGRRIYTNKEIAALLNVKEYFVSAVLKDTKPVEV